jgi:hypothetical protein
VALFSVKIDQILSSTAEPSKMLEIFKKKYHVPSEELLPVIKTRLDQFVSSLPPNLDRNNRASTVTIKDGIADIRDWMESLSVEISQKSKLSQFRLALAYLAKVSKVTYVLYELILL